MKKVSHDGKDIHLGLLEYRNTPWSDTIGSPAQCLMGRRTKTLVPTTGALLQPNSSVQKELAQHRQQQKYYFYQHTKPLTKLKTGESILVSANGSLLKSLA